MSSLEEQKWRFFNIQFIIGINLKVIPIYYLYVENLEPMHLLKFDWNPLTGIEILGNFKLHFYSVMWIVAFLTGWYIMKRIFTKEKVSLEYLDPLFIYTVLATMIGARLGHVIFYQSELITQDFWSIFLPIRTNPRFEFTGFQGLASHGAAIGIIVGMYLYRKKYNYKSLLWILDRVVISVASGAVFIRIGNFINSEIIGKVTDSDFVNHSLFQKIKTK